MGLFTLILAAILVTPDDELDGAWILKAADNHFTTYVFVENYFSISEYRGGANPKFIATKGGTWIRKSQKRIELTFEYHTVDSTMVGTTEAVEVAIGQKGLIAGGELLKFVDDGTPGELRGAWLITGRMRNGEMRERTPGARKTMKILTGTRFQWIAYNTESGAFSGTGGGTYSTEGGRYVENIEFFSRDNSRVGASLSFDFELIDGKWHHKGLSSRGSPIHEVWTSRKHL